MSNAAMPEGKRMNLLEEICRLLMNRDAKLEESNDVYSAVLLIAERRAFLIKKKLTYIAKFRVDEAAKELRFTEMLKESGWGLSGGDIDSSPGWGFKAQKYRIGAGAREGTIVEQSTFFGRKYSYVFDFKDIRSAIEEKTRASGYTFKYQLTLRKT
jgi:hypothetical protein